MPYKRLYQYSDKELLASWREAEAAGLCEGDWAKQYGLPIYTTIPRLYDILEAERQGKETKRDLFDIETKTRWDIKKDSVMVVGDVQVPTVDWDFARMVSYVAERRMEKPRTLAIIGDFMNFDCWSPFPDAIIPPTWRRERDDARHLMKQWLETFQEIRWLFGNHERRKLYSAQAQEDEEDILTLLRVNDRRVLVSVYDRMRVKMPTGYWNLAHGGDYSQNLLIKQELYAQKYQTHIASGHCHRFGMGVDKYGRYMIVSTGGLFDKSKMAYVQLTTTSRPEMVQGFVLLNHGYPEMYSPMITNWDKV